MTDLKNAVLATLAYYDVFDFPLTLLEIHRYLINPARVDKNIEGVGDVRLGDIDLTLKELITSGRAIERNGYYFLSQERTATYETRIDREKVAAQKWKKLLRIGYWFQVIPFLRAVLVSGSMAMLNTDEESDFDVLVIVKNKRMYTCRIMLSSVASLFRARRKRFDKVAPDKFCFNHYISDAQLKISNESLYNAQTYVNLRPAYVRGNVFEELYRENPWLNRYIYNFTPSFLYVRRMIRPSRILHAIAKIGEWLLGGFLGNFLETVLRGYQRRRIARNPVTYASGGRTIFNDAQLEFHPHSAERAILKKYNTTLTDLGTFWNYQELDSGWQ